MNRAMLRAEALYYGALALPRHANVGRWKQLAETLASDSLKQWEIEDAAHYQPIWLLSVFSYAEISGRTEFFDSPIVHYYMEYFLNLLAPHGNVADFGDAHWNSGWDRFIPVFEKAASAYRNPQYKHVAREMLVRTRQRLQAARQKAGQPLELNGQPLLYGGTGFGSALTDAYRWADDSIVPQVPTTPEPGSAGRRHRQEDCVSQWLGSHQYFSDAQLPRRRGRRPVAARLPAADAFRSKKKRCITATQTRTASAC